MGGSASCMADLDWTEPAIFTDAMASLTSSSMLDTLADMLVHVDAGRAPLPGRGGCSPETEEQTGRGRGPAAGEVLKLVYSLQSAQCVACQQRGDICKPAQHSGAAADLDVPGVARGPRALYVSRPPFLVLPRTGSTVEAYDTLASASRGAAGPEECATTTSAGHTGSAGSAGEIDSGRLLNTAGAGPGQGPAMTTHSARTARMRGTRPPVRRF